MAAVGSITTTDQSGLGLRPVRKVSLAWTSDASGAVSGIFTDYLSGALARVAFVPHGGGTAPTANYDVTLLDESGLDVLSGQGADLSATVTTHVCPGVPLKDGTTTATLVIHIDDKLELRVANAGNAKQGTIVLYILAT